MIFLKHLSIIFFMLVGMGCTYPGQAGLTGESVIWEQDVPVPILAFSDCIADLFNKELPGIMTLNTPVSSVNQRANGLQVISANSAGVWNWKLDLSSTVEGSTLVKAEVRNSGINPYLSNDYFIKKMRENISLCSVKK